jgi:hypothetical protein
MGVDSIDGEIAMAYNLRRKNRGKIVLRRKLWCRRNGGRLG